MHRSSAAFRFDVFGDQLIRGRLILVLSKCSRCNERDKNNKDYRKQIHMKFARQNGWGSAFRRRPFFSLIRPTCFGQISDTAPPRIFKVDCKASGLSKVFGREMDLEFNLDSKR